mgnify:CR=1 FL=1
MSSQETQPLPEPIDDGAHRPVGGAILTGMKKRCPNCGKGHLFAGYTKVSSACTVCGQPLADRHRADDAPPYVTMMIVGHLLAIPIVEVKRHLDPSMGFQLILWLTLALSLSFILLPMVKGGLIGLQWAQRMHGFGPVEEDDTEASLRPSSQQ